MRKLCSGGCGIRIPLDRSRCNRCQQQRRERREAEGRTGQNGVRRDQGLARLVKARDGHRCVRCGSGRRVEVHHRDGDPRNNNQANLETLCGDCHDQADAELKAERAAQQPSSWREAREAI